MPHGKGIRCTGYMGHDGKFAHCSREELAGDIKPEQLGTYAHRLEGPCRCGQTHGDAAASYPPVPIRSAPRGTQQAQNPAPDLPFREVATYEYEGGLVVVRAENGVGRKKFWQSHRLPDGTLVKGAPAEVPRTCYRADEVRAAPAEAFVWFVEGEKCADALRARGFVATTTPQGAKSFALAREHAVKLLAGRHVVVLPDNDPDGRAFAAEVIAAIKPGVASLRELHLPGLGDAEDVADWLERGGDPEDLVGMAEARPNLADRTPGIVWLSTADIFAPLPVTPWVIPDLMICPGRPTLIAGYGYSGKTLLSQALMVSVAAGAEAWGRFATGNPSRVRHADFEQGNHATRKRYQRLAFGMDILPAQLAGRLEVTIFPNAYLNSPGADDLYCRISEGCSIVMIDSLRAATPGEDENDSQMAAWLHVLARASEKTGACFLVVHHAGKPGKEGSRDGKRDGRTLARGSSAIFDACGAVFNLVGEKGKSTRVEQVKAPAEAEGGAVDDFRIRIEDVIDLTTGNPKAGVRIRYESGDDAPALPRQRKSKVEEHEGFRAAIIELVKTTRGLKSANQIELQIEGNRAAILRALKHLVEDEKKIVIAGGEYRLAPETQGGE